MKRTFYFLTLSTVLLSLLFSCNKADKTGLLVPKDAGIVVHINSGSLSSKLSWEEISQTDWFKDLAKETTDSTAQKLLSDPAHSGIDTKASLVFYLRKQGRGGYAVFTGTMKDPAAFEAFCKEINKGEGQATKESGLSYMTMEKSGIVAWNNARFAYIGNSPLPDIERSMEGDRSSTNYKYSIDSLKELGKLALTLRDKDNLDNDKRFASLIEDNSDVHIWTNISGLYGNSIAASMMSMMKVSTLLEGNVSANSLNFENGKIAVKSKQYYGEEMQKLLASHPAKPLSADVLNRLPSQNIVGLLALSYPPEGIRDFLKVTGLDGAANGFLGNIGYSVDEFIKANKGELLLSVSDLEIKKMEKVMDMGEGQPPYKYTTTQPDMKVLFATSINDRAAFDKLIGIAMGERRNMPSAPEIHYKLDKDWFAASNYQEEVDKFLSGTSNKNAIADKISGQPFGMYIDLQKIISSAKSSIKDSSGQAAMAASNIWQDIVAAGGAYKDKAMSFTFEVNLVDKNTNSLKQLNQYINNLYKINSERKNRYRDTAAEMESESPGSSQ
jgi:hypothetical protein